jgi:SOUL heme-binding protein
MKYSYETYETRPELNPMWRAVYVVLFLMFAGSEVMAKDIEEPRWELLTKIGEVEVRRYEPSVQAVTRIGSNARTTEGFKRLAGYIFGGNDGGQSIAMTAPVAETLGTDDAVMAFTMPAAYDMAQLPDPDDERVEIVPVPQRTVAVVRFSGWATDGRIERSQELLMATLASHAISPVGAPYLNQYNPPWTPPFLRRNEIAVEIDVPAGGLVTAANLTR